MTLPGVLYREIMAGLGLEPSEVSVWQEVLNLLGRVAAAPACFRPLTTLRQTAEQQVKRAAFDFSPDPKANRFPALSTPVEVSPKVAQKPVTLRALFVMWQPDHLSDGKSAKTVSDFRQITQTLIEFLGQTMRSA